MKILTAEKYQRSQSSRWYALFFVPKLYVTRQFIEFQSELGKIEYWSPAPWYRFAYTDYERDLRVYGFGWLVYLLKLWNWYLMHRWCIEKFLLNRNILHLDEGWYYKEAKFNWNIRDWKIK